MNKFLLSLLSSPLALLRRLGSNNNDDSIPLEAHLILLEAVATSSIVRSTLLHMRHALNRMEVLREHNQHMIRFEEVEEAMETHKTLVMSDVGSLIPLQASLGGLLVRKDTYSPAAVIAITKTCELFSKNNKIITAAVNENFAAIETMRGRFSDPPMWD